jgi:hypothetical protein
MSEQAITLIFGFIFLATAFYGLFAGRYSYGDETFRTFHIFKSEKPVSFYFTFIFLFGVSLVLILGGLGVIPPHVLKIEGNVLEHYATQP